MMAGAAPVVRARHHVERVVGTSARVTLAGVHYEVQGRNIKASICGQKLNQFASGSSKHLNTLFVDFQERSTHFIIVVAFQKPLAEPNVKTGVVFFLQTSTRFHWSTNSEPLGVPRRPFPYSVCFFKNQISIHDV